MTTHTNLIARLRSGWTTDRLLAANALESLEQQNAELVAALKDWDTLIKYNYSGSRDAMSAMQICAFNTKDILDKVKQP